MSEPSENHLRVAQLCFRAFYCRPSEPDEQHEIREVAEILADEFPNVESAK